ncbi:MAG: hypoxanthine phosphoribosyltransferase [Clostridia bacterium]|nr:hypoxanthine phosphoribosyltransferase [Clostridia bacterium]
MNGLESYRQHIGRELISEADIKAAIKEAGKKIDAIYDGHPILLVSILKGAFVFLADVCRAVTVPCEIGFMCAKSYYDSTVSTGTVSITMDLEQDVTGYHVVIVEDIIDTGRTLKEVAALLRARRPQSLHILTLLDKPSRRVVEIEADIVLFTIPDHFVIGYGLDCGELFRNLPYVAEYNQD